VTKATKGKKSKKAAPKGKKRGELSEKDTDRVAGGFTLPPTDYVKFKVDLS
jgi:hypothetical protein